MSQHRAVRPNFMAPDDREPEEVKLTQGSCEEGVECGRSVLLVRQLRRLLSGDDEDDTHGEHSPWRPTFASAECS